MQLSVVVTVVDGGDALRRCLQSLARQEHVSPIEVIVPYDDSIREVADFAAEFPHVRFLALGRIDTARDKRGAAGQHELFDVRRAAGLAEASGDLVAILEDRGVPARNWARTAVALHERFPNAVIGGAVENGRDRLLNWAVFFCDFGRYQPPLAGGPADYATDVNICYKRVALQRVSNVWRNRYHETSVHWALQRMGETLLLSPDLLVTQIRDHLRFTSLVGERLAWGRLFAYTRARELSPLRRLALMALSPVLPIVLLVRHTRLQYRKRATLSRFVCASPMVLVLLAAWSLGEMVGYGTGQP